MDKITINRVRGKSVNTYNFILSVNGTDLVSRSYTAATSARRAARNLRSHLLGGLYFEEDNSYALPVVDNTLKR